MIMKKILILALRELGQAGMLEEKKGGTLWVTRELYWQCQSFFQQSNQLKEVIPPAPSEQIEKIKTLENHITKEEFLLEFFGLFGRDLGNPERWFHRQSIRYVSLY